MWVYKGKTINKIEDTPENSLGFIYKITNITNNKFYIGKKQFTFNKKTKLGKKEIKEQTGRGRKKLTKRVTGESNWYNYWGSSKPLLLELKTNKENFTREILEFCYSKKQLTYYELYYHFMYDVLTSHCYNENILGRFFRNDLIEESKRNNPYLNF